MADLLFALGVVIIAATFFTYLARLFRQPLLVGYVVAGILIGPLGLGLITDPGEITTLAELGVAFLLFTVGLEIDVQRLKSVGAAALTGGLVQIAVTFAMGFLVALAFGFGNMVGLYMGMLLAFSSTMIVAKLLADENEVATLHGRIMLGILILQDIVVIMLLPMLGNIYSIFSPELVGMIFLKGMGLFSIAIVLNRFVFKKVLEKAAKGNEVLFFTAVSTCFLFIGFSYALGFSIAIGAFLGGLAMAQFPYNVEIFGEMRSLRDFFSVLFFASLGMQLNVLTVYHMFPVFLVFLFLLVIAKPLVLAVTYLFKGYGGRVSSEIALGMGQASEFTFIIAAQGLALGQLTGDFYSLILSILVVSIVVTPYMSRYQDKVYKFFRGLKIHPSFFRPTHIERLHKDHFPKMDNHVIIFGAGLTGSRVIQYLKAKGEKFVVVEHDPEIVNKLNEGGVHCMYGEADNEEVLKKVGLCRAKMIIMAIPDVPEVMFVIQKARRFNKKTKILVRAYTNQEETELTKAGAHVVIIPKIVSANELIRHISARLK